MLFPLFSCYKMNQRLIRHFEYKGLVHLAEERRLVFHCSNFEFRGKWRFEYKNRTIAADIKDDDFILRVKSGELEFKSKDVLTADLKIEQERLPGSQYWEDKRFCVVKVHARDNLRDSEFLQQ